LVSGAISAATLIARVKGFAGGSLVREGTSSHADDLRAKERTLDFILNCAREDGGYAPSPDPAYPGNSDTGLSDLAAVTYALILARTVGWDLPNRDRSADFVQRHQQPDGSFASFAGSFDPRSDLAILYNTTQGTVALRTLGLKPKVPPTRAMDRFFEKDAFKRLPWYTTSFFPLFYAASGETFPRGRLEAVRNHMAQHQAADGYLGDHVAAAFHMAHYFRMIGQPVPRAADMVRRVLKDQKPDGGWNIKEPDWDVHACFDAVFILHQLGGDSEACRMAISKAAAWTLRCHNADGGFGHFPAWHSDMDAVYFQYGTLIQAGRVPDANFDLPDAHVLSWGHAMKPGRIYAEK
jgi:geranylgeranyl transferase type-2 subunit beta